MRLQGIRRCNLENGNAYHYHSLDCFVLPLVSIVFKAVINSSLTEQEIKFISVTNLVSEI